MKPSFLSFNMLRGAGLDPARLAACGIFAHEHGDYEGARYLLDAALAIRPLDPLASWHRSLVGLALHEFETAWTDYAYRGAVLGKGAQFYGDDACILCPFPDNFRGRRVIVHGEQGIGDEIMFASCIPDLCAIARDVTLTCDPRLVNLFSDSLVCERVQSRYEPAPPEIARDALHVYAGSLPHAFRRSRAAFSGAPYLDAFRRIATRISSSGGSLSPIPPLSDRRANVGLCWNGGTPETRGALRSINAHALRRALPDAARYWALTHDDLTNMYAIVPDCNLFADFRTLAAFVKSLDLVVTVQCSIAHLCGALGVPCVVLLSAAPEWRYGAYGERMPWYSSLTLARQERLGDWTRPLLVARERIEKLCAAIS